MKLKLKQLKILRLFLPTGLSQKTRGVFNPALKLFLWRCWEGWELPFLPHGQGRSQGCCCKKATLAGADKRPCPTNQVGKSGPCKSPTSRTSESRQHKRGFCEHLAIRLPSPLLFSAGSHLAKCHSVWLSFWNTLISFSIVPRKLLRFHVRLRGSLGRFCAASAAASATAAAARFLVAFYLTCNLTFLWRPERLMFGRESASCL